MEAEQKAKLAPEAVREGLIDLAAQWRDMALDAHLLALLGKKPGRDGLASSPKAVFATRL